VRLDELSGSAELHQLERTGRARQGQQTQGCDRLGARVRQACGRFEQANESDRVRGKMMLKPAAKTPQERARSTCCWQINMLVHGAHVHSNARHQLILPSGFDGAWHGHESRLMHQSNAAF
jgi:hypothetical protein